MEEGNCFEFLSEPTEYLLDHVRRDAKNHSQHFEIRRNNHQICWVSNPGPNRMKQFPILLEEVIVDA